MGARSAWQHFEAVAWPALALAPSDYLASIRGNLVADCVPNAVGAGDSARLFNWLIGVSQYQGISDRAAAAFTAKHGMISFADIKWALSFAPSCPRLHSYWAFAGCGYRKTTQRCAGPGHIAACSLPHHPARKGTLIQAAYSLFLFVRDICNGNLVGWIDRQLADADPGGRASDRALHMGAALLAPLRQIYGIGDKVWSMALADLLLAADPSRERWVTTGAGMVVVDSLLHNHLHRTGVLRRFGAEHLYGARCYAPGGCCDLLRGLAERIDARDFDPSFPACFPRFVQFAIWRLCSTSELDMCNGNRIDDRNRCQNTGCPAFVDCDRLALFGPLKA